MTDWLTEYRALAPSPQPKASRRASLSKKPEILPALLGIWLDSQPDDRKLEDALLGKTT